MSIYVASSSKNACYSDALRYLKYKHKEDLEHNRYQPILDEYGFLQERDNYGLCYINGYGEEKDPDDWVGNCIDTNLKFGKNQSYNERKQIIFVISHPESDIPLLTTEALLEEGRAFVRDNLKGYDALVCAHKDSNFPHLHISINSVRAVERPEQPWMMRDANGCVLRCEVAAGGKHQNSPQFRRHCQEWLLEYTRSHGLTVEDNLRVEDQRKQDRYAKKHEYLRKTILDTASHCKSMKELTQHLYDAYSITLFHRGTTYSVRLPDAKKSIRLDSIDLSVEKLYETMHVSMSELQAFRTAQQIEFERKKYIQWLRERRQKNDRKAEDTIADAAALIAGKVPIPGDYYRKQDFQELHDLIKQTVYLQRDLQTELDKIDRLLERWRLFLDSSTNSQDRASHGSYIRWCGCSPNSEEEFQDLQQERDIISLQIREATAVRDALIDSADQWQEHNAETRFYYHESWTLRREELLQHQLSAVKANRKKLSQIAYNCQKAADHRIYNQALQQKAVHFRRLWHEKLMEEKALKQELWQVKQEANAIRINHEIER